MILKKQEKYYVLFFGLVILFSSWTVYYHLPFLTVFYIVAIIFIFRFESPYSKERTSYFLLFLPLSLYVGIPSSNLLDPETINFRFVGLLLLSFLFLMRPRIIKSVYNSFTTILALILVPGAIFHVLYILNIYHVQSFTTVITEHDRFYNIYPFFVREGSSINAFRFNSIFDEPGYLGTLAAFILVLENINLKTWKNIVIFFSGLITFSLSFFILVGLYFVITSIRKKISNVIVVMIIVFVVYFSFSLLVDKYIFKRLEMDNGWIAGDNRGGKDNIEQSIAFFSKQDLFKTLFGSGEKAFQQYQGSLRGIYASTWTRLVFQIGIIPLIYLLWFILFSSKKSFNSLVFGILFILSIYQRPQVFQPIFIFFLVYNTVREENIVVSTKLIKQYKHNM